MDEGTVSLAWAKWERVLDKLTAAQDYATVLRRWNKGGGTWETVLVAQRAFLEHFPEDWAKAATQ